ncbi:MAG: FxsA family protein [Candidatus Aminicenantaceae bacterium]
MFFRLLLLFTLVPLVELYILFKVGGLIGALNTILIIVVTGIAGAYLARSQGFKVVKRINRAIEEGRTPANELLDGLFILIGGFTLLTPGFLTDLLGLSMLFPLTRTLYTRFALKLIQNKIDTGQWFIHRY